MLLLKSIPLALF